MRTVRPGRAWARSQSAPSPVPESTEPPAGMGPPRASRSSVTLPEASRTASAPSPGSVVGPKMGVKWISSLSSVQVKSCFGASVGASPPSPPQPRIRPGSRFVPSTRRVAPSDDVAEMASESAATSAPSPSPAGRTRLVRPSTASLTRSPSITEMPARSPGVPSASPITKYPPFMAARAFVRVAIAVRSSRSGTISVASSGSSVPA